MRDKKEILAAFFKLYNQNRLEHEPEVWDFQGLDLLRKPDLAQALSKAGFEAEVEARIEEQSATVPQTTLDGKFDHSAKTVKTPPKIGPDELGNAETRGHQLVESSSKTVDEPTVEIDFENDYSVFAVGGDEDELDVIPTRVAARLPASPDDPTLRELELSDFKEEETVNVGTAPPPIPAAITQLQPPTVLGSSWSQEAPTTPRAPALQQKKRRCFFGMTLTLLDLVLMLGATVTTVMLGTTCYELGRNRERSFWQKLFAERPVIEKKCGEPVMVFLDRQPPSRPDARAAAAAAPVQKPQPKIRRSTTVVRRLPSPSRPVVVEVPAVMGTYPLPPAGDSRESVLATLKRACGSDPKWIDQNREPLTKPEKAVIRVVCQEDMVSRLRQFAPVPGYPVITLKIRQS